MKPNLSRSLGKARIIFGSLLLVALILSLSIYTFQKSNFIPKSTFKLDSQKNKFQGTFNLSSGDQKNSESLLSKLNIPQSIVKGFEIELDSTTSAKLAFSSPINASFSTKVNQLQFNGTTSHQLINDQFKLKNFKIPQSVQISVFGVNLHSFVFSRLNIPPELQNWLSNNLQKDKPEYLLIFNNADMALLWPNKQIDFTSLKDINPTSNSFKEEIQEDITYALYKLPKSENRNELSLSFFTVGDFAVLATSQNGAKEIVNAIKTQGNSQNFSEDTTEASFYIKYQNADRNLDVNLKPLLFGSNYQTQPKEKIFQAISKLTEFQLTLKANSFSGLINW